MTRFFIILVDESASQPHTASRPAGRTRASGPYAGIHREGHFSSCMTEPDVDSYGEKDAA
jgi:hypothetical protein